jgi:hypothetical protein
MEGCVSFLLSCCLLTGCSSRQPATPTSESPQATVPGAKILAVGMSQEEALRRLHSAGAMEVAKDVLPDAMGWAVVGSHDCLFLSLSNGTVAGISVEGNSDKPKMYRTWHSTNAYALP